ncbi:hypothetical protein FRC08_006625, partial [Ceratobasidium sp. 394]
PPQNISAPPILGSSVPYPPATPHAFPPYELWRNIQLPEGGGDRIARETAELAPNKQFDKFWQKFIPVTYETFTTHANKPTGLDSVHLPLAIEPLACRTQLLELMGLSGANARNVCYIITGVSKVDPAKPFVTIDEVEGALETVRDLASRARAVPKGLKIINKDPVAKSAAVVTLVDRSRQQDKTSKKKAKSKAEVKRMVSGAGFIADLLDHWPPCSKHGGLRCYICPRTAKHLPLTHKVASLWATEHAKDPSGVTVTRPPNYFDCDRNRFPLGRTPLPTLKVEPKSKTKTEPKYKLEIDLEDEKHDIKLKGDSAGSPICIDLDSPNDLAPLEFKPTPTPIPKFESPDYIRSSSESDGSVIGSLSAPSTRFPSPSELLSPTVRLLFNQLQAAHSDLNFTPFISRLDSFGVHFAYELVEPGRSAEWLVTQLRMPVTEASLAVAAARNSTSQQNNTVTSVAGPSHF